MDGEPHHDCKVCGGVSQTGPGRMRLRHLQCIFMILRQSEVLLTLLMDMSGRVKNWRVKVWSISDLKDNYSFLLEIVESDPN